MGNNLDLMEAGGFLLSFFFRMVSLWMQVLVLCLSSLIYAKLQLPKALKANGESLSDQARRCGKLQR
jgi:hypothetical protein